jgi:hypothetical protein
MSGKGAFCGTVEASQKMYVNQSLSVPETEHAAGPNGGFGGGSEYVFLGAAFLTASRTDLLAKSPIF